MVFLEIATPTPEPNNIARKVLSHVDLSSVYVNIGKGENKKK